MSLHRCGACGRPGHNARTCTTPDPAAQERRRRQERAESNRRANEYYWRRGEKKHRRWKHAKRTKHRCTGCDNLGHNIRTCEAVS